jgi:hypothetical protein
MLSPNPFDTILISQLDEGVAMPVDLIIRDSDNQAVLHDRIFTVKKIIQTSELNRGLYRVTMTNEFGLVHEGYYNKV